MDKGPLKILVPPEQDKHYAIAVDSALNVSGGDYTCAQVVEWQHNEQVAVWHGRAHPDEFAYKLLRSVTSTTRPLLRSRPIQASAAVLSSPFFSTSFAIQISTSESVLIPLAARSVWSVRAG